MKIPINRIRTAGQSHFKERDFCLSNTSSSRSAIILKILGVVAFFTYFFCASFICVILVSLSILPFKYFAILIITLLLLTVFFGFITIRKPKKIKKLTKILKIIVIVLEIIFSAIFIIAFSYLNHTMNFMDSIRATEYQIDNYSVLVKKDSKFKVIEDLHYGTIATYDDNSQSYNSALEKLTEKIRFKQNQKENLSDAVKSIITDESDALLIKSSLTDIAFEIFDNFNSEDYINLYTITIETRVAKTESADINTTRDSFNIYISGIDTNGNIATVSRSDVNMIVTVNPRTHTILLTSIPRDYYVQLHGTAGLKDKLTHSGLYGINMTIDTVQDFLNVNINYYVRVNFDSTVNLIDALDGIDIIPDTTFTAPAYDHYCYYAANTTNHLDGSCALAYARERKVYGTGDLHRIQNQQDVIMAIINKLTSSRVILTKYTEILSSMSGTLETNIPSSDIYSLVNLQLDSMPSWTIERVSLEGEHIDAPTYTISDQYLFVFVPDEASVTTVSEKIKSVMDAN